ncbi:hypothetical protein [Salinispora arenicola]|uniref:hypothetical protein n=1 Tax=Salinispora arenicola TaxID=168697 RepID=UPI0027DD6701|nr:hypothetical protein [Salinispora arenicola]
MSAATTAARATRTRPRLSPDFLRLWWADGISAIGDGITIAAAPLLATRLTDDPRLIVAASVAFTAPFVLFGIPAGLIVDRLRPSPHDDVGQPRPGWAPRGTCRRDRRRVGRSTTPLFFHVPPRHR